MTFRDKMPDNNLSVKSPAQNRKRPSYHRGNVREDLIALGKKILESEGLGAITLRRLTREIGVNPTNFYNHFSNMDYLYAAIKVEGFQQLLGRQKKATENCPNKLNAARMLCHEILFFAIESPNLYRLMFDNYHDFQKHQELKKVTDETMAFVIETLYGKDIFDPSDPLGFYRTHPMAVACWSMIHGLTHILIERQIELNTKSRKKVIEFANNVIDELFHGIEDQLQE